MRHIRALILPAVTLVILFWGVASVELLAIQAYFDSDDGIGGRLGEWIWTGGSTSPVWGIAIALVSFWAGYRATQSRSIWAAAGAGLAVISFSFGMWVIWALVVDGWGEAREFFVGPYSGLISGILLAVIAGVAGGFMRRFRCAEFKR